MPPAMASGTVVSPLTRTARPDNDARVVVTILQRLDELRTLSDASLGDLTDALRERAADHPHADSELIPLAFAAAGEAIRRTLGMTLYDVQMLAGLALTRGCVAEMQTGEGKTVAAIAPAYVRVILGDSVHLGTVNDYLAERDHAQVQPVFDLLHVRTGLLQTKQESEAKQNAYRSDVVYGPGYEFGFDYLRDQVQRLATPMMRLGDRFRQSMLGERLTSTDDIQSRRDFAIIDEIDSVLLDEAHVPLVISQGQTAAAPEQERIAYVRAHQLAGRLTLAADYQIDTTQRRVQLTQAGWDRAQEFWRNNRDMTLHRAWHIYVEQALHARCIFRRDVDYVVANEKVHIVDANTGRIFEDRSWRDGLHQAIQVHERVTVTAEQPSIAQISRQRFYSLYRQISGMTGTAQGSEREFRAIYGLSVVPIPLRRPCRRRVEPMRFFASQEQKWRAIVADVVKRSASGQPILIGTRNIECSEALSALLIEQKVPHRILNGKQDRSEAEIVAEAGQSGAITVATNMAGRGTDIRLGTGRPQECGLHVIGEECHELFRVDRQLMGRAARQGDPGSCQFFVSADDLLLREHAPALGDQLRSAAARNGECQGEFAKRIRRTQERVEKDGFRQRQDLLRHDRWIEDMMDRLAKEIP